jgi:hypothetical protein
VEPEIQYRKETLHITQPCGTFSSDSRGSHPCRALCRGVLQETAANLAIFGELWSQFLHPQKISDYTGDTCIKISIHVRPNIDISCLSSISKFQYENENWTSRCETLLKRLAAHRRLRPSAPSGTTWDWLRDFMTLDIAKFNENLSSRSDKRQGTLQKSCMCLVRGSDCMGSPHQGSSPGDT